MSSKLYKAVASRSLKLKATENCAIEFLSGEIMPIVLIKGEEVDFFAVCHATNNDICNSTLIRLYREGKVEVVE